MSIVMHNQFEPRYAEMLNARMMEAFGFSFGPWFERGQWDARYECYSILDEQAVLSNAGVFKNHMIVQGRAFDALQIGAVATRPDMRNRGLCRQIMEHVIERYPDTPMFLHAAPTAVELYPKFGFRRVQEWAAHVPVTLDNAIEPMPLKLGDEVLTRSIMQRGAHSDALDILGADSLIVFHLLMDADWVPYHIPTLDAVVLAEQTGDRLFLADVIAPERIDFDVLLRHLPFRGVRQIEFGFCPDWLGVSPEWRALCGDAHPVFVRGEWDLLANWRIPVTSVT